MSSLTTKIKKLKGLKMDEIGVPYCVTVDFDTLDDGSVTIRDRNTTEQKRIAVDELVA